MRQQAAVNAYEQSKPDKREQNQNDSSAFVTACERLLALTS